MFTTSGHASRHAKIHRAEKEVVCVVEGCGKRFRRGDNMKQHAETHFRGKGRGRGRKGAAEKTAEEKGEKIEVKKEMNAGAEEPPVVERSAMDGLEMLAEAAGHR